MPQLSLKARIFAGFAIIMSLLVLIGIVSYFGQKRLRSETAKMHSIDRLSTTVQQIDRDVQELRLRVAWYVSSGYDSQRDEAQKIHDRIIAAIESAKSEQDDGGMANLFEQISLHINQYAEQFQSVVKERSLRMRLVNSNLPSRSETVENLLSSLTKSLENTPESSSDFLGLSQTQALFSQTEKLFLRYYTTPESNLVNSAVRSLRDANLIVESTNLAQSAKTQLKEAFLDYERIGLRAIQATRSYLFLVNVVMAGEASEVSHYSRLLREKGEESRQTSAELVEATEKTVNRVLSVIFPLALLLSLLIAARLALLIIPPIAALTTTFNKLSAGETLHEIPGTQRRDEIGQMAKAARVFNEQNLQTRTLLEELESKAEQLAATNQELDSFAYIASHDLKSPLRGIKQLSTWIEEDAGDALSSDSVQHLRLLKSRVAKMESLLEDLLNFSRVGKLEPVEEKVDVSELLKGIEDLTDNPNGVQLRWADDLPTFSTLRAPLQQVLLNLIGNAIKHNHRESEGLVELDWQKQGDKYQFSIRDNGPGIREKDHERVFQMYQRVGDTSVDGSGMGLAIVKKQIEHVGGELELDSKLGEGATFKFTWPAQITNRA